ncbi:MAG: alpha-mannosidase [Prochloraceae cyanobacterium]|nr:alpha-mannosidase [Prochloraceae cyanobacterium]
MNITKRSNKISNCIELLYQLTQINVQTGWRYYTEDLNIRVPSTEKFFCQEIENYRWLPVQLNDRGYIVREAGEKVIWLKQNILIPTSLQGYSLFGFNLRLVLTWWAKYAQIYVNGKLVQEGDLFESSARILLTPRAIAGETIVVVIKLVTPGHDIGALMKSICVYDRADRDKEIDPSFVADEITVLNQYLTAFEPNRLEILAAAIEKIDWQAVEDRDRFDLSLSKLRDRLLPLSKIVKQSSINLLSHAHLDLAWLWTVAETLEVADRTFNSVLSLQQDYPYLTFCHTTPALYEQIEQNNPDLFTQIQKAVKNKTWEVLGGMWVEPEINLVSGESLVRQLLYGQKYIQEKFGKITKIAWLPDSFGFCASLPQILVQSGIKYFVTGKLHWNDTNKFPHGFFKWRSPDGSEVLTLMSPPNLTGVMDTNPITMANYGVDWQLQTKIKDAFWLPGVGDRGGGPSRDMLEVFQRCSQSPFFPNLKFTRAIDYLEKIATYRDLPVWDEELYLELHRGCYTTHGEQKYFNRRCEDLLYQAELWASLACIASESEDYPNVELEKAWKKVLFNQFHDILPGTSIPEVFVDADRDWLAAKTIANNILSDSMDAIAARILFPTPPKSNAIPIIVFNSLNWKRSEVVSLDLEGVNWEIYTLEAKKLSTQISHDNKLLFLAEDVPSVGYKVFWLSRSDREKETKININSDRQGFVLENEFLKVKVNPQTGDLTSIFDKRDRREILNGAGNQLQAFQDRGQYWDAWNIDPNYERYRLDDTQLKSIEHLEFGPIRFLVRVARQLGKSEFIQDYILETNSPLLEIATIVNWQETHVLVKAAFPLNLNCDRVTHEIPFGAISRPTNPETSTEKAKWEIPISRWLNFDLDNTDSANCQDYGVSFLNDSKYGCDIKSDRMRITLLRSPVWPDPNADRGKHQFSYAVYPHQGNWQSAFTVRRGYELNIPLKVKILVNPCQNNSKVKSLPAIARLLDLGANNLVLSAFKLDENSDEKKWLVRFYESNGETAELALESDWDIFWDRSLDLLERPLKLDLEKDSDRLKIRPWKIVTLKIEPRFRVISSE